jgi:hypothetical protein
MTQMQSKYTFTQEYTDEYGQTAKVEHTFYADTHDEVAARFNEFLRGCGFIFNHGESYLLTEEYDGGGVWSTTDLGDAVLDEYDYEPSDNYQHSDNSWPFEMPHQEECKKCGMTRRQMGSHNCYEKTGCGLGLDAAL